MEGAINILATGVSWQRWRRAARCRFAGSRTRVAEKRFAAFFFPGVHFSRTSFVVSRFTAQGKEAEANLGGILVEAPLSPRRSLLDLSKPFLHPSTLAFEVPLAGP
ncbi:hypothetical protein MRX96_023930 [Rhipicephalus microplus]